MIERNHDGMLIYRVPFVHYYSSLAICTAICNFDAIRRIQIYLFNTRYKLRDNYGPVIFFTEASKLNYDEKQNVKYRFEPSPFKCIMDDRLQ